MIQFFKDSQLTVPVTAENPIMLMVPSRGGTKRFSLWLADTYSTSVRVAAAAGDSSVKLVDTFRLPDSGELSIGGESVHYSAKDAWSVTGVPGSGPGSILTAAPIHTPVYPLYEYSGDTALMVTARGAAATRSGFRIAMKRQVDAGYGIPGVPLLFTEQTFENLSAGLPAAIVRIDVEVTVDAGADAELSGWSFETNPFEIESLGLSDIVAYAPGVIYRKDQGLSCRVRYYPKDRVIPDSIPGFVFGEHRWRDEDAVNADTLIPSKWDISPESIGVEKFVSGIGDRDDLKMLSVVKEGNSIHPELHRGHYFVGPSPHYVPANPVLEIFPVSSGEQLLLLSSSPRPQSPIFVGCYKAGPDGTYNTFIQYRSVGHRDFEKNDQYQYRTNRGRTQLTVNKTFSISRQFLGLAPDADKAVFDIPIFPVYSVSRVILSATQSHVEEEVAFSYDRQTGQLSLNLSGNTSPAGRELFADCQPALAVHYDRSTVDSRLIEEVDFNPAFSGLSEGYLYLSHRRNYARSIELFADKSRIIVPKEYELVSGIVAYGPVFYENDFVLLQGVAYGSSSEERIQNKRLRVVVDNSFQGLVNYQDPSSEPLYVLTGGDGISSFIYTPPEAYGYYLHPSSVEDDTVTLPDLVEFNQIYKENEGWKTWLYYVTNNDGFFGKVGANVNVGEIPWQEIGSAGQASYKTNGRRFLWKDGPVAKQPLYAIDQFGVRHDQVGFSGRVKQLVYDEDVLTVSSLGSYFFAFVGRVVLQVQDEESGAISNKILLQMEAPPELVDETGVAGYLIPNDEQGRLNVNRLGGAPIFPANVNTMRY